MPPSGPAGPHEAGQRFGEATEPRLALGQRDLRAAALGDVVMGAAHEHRAAAGIAHDLAAARNPAKLARVGAADAELVGVARGRRDRRTGRRAARGAAPGPRGRAGRGTPRRSASDRARRGPARRGGTWSATSGRVPSTSRARTRRPRPSQKPSVAAPRSPPALRPRRRSASLRSSGLPARTSPRPGAAGRPRPPTPPRGRWPGARAAGASRGDPARPRQPPRPRSMLSSVRRIGKRSGAGDRGGASSPWPARGNARGNPNLRYAVQRCSHEWLPVHRGGCNRKASLPPLFSRGRKGHARLGGAGLLGCVRTGEFTPMALDNLRADAEAAFPRRTRRDADQTRRDILAAAAAEFSEKGYAGGRVDDIAARTSTHQADDLLLLRRQGGALRRGAGAGLWRDARRRGRAPPGRAAAGRGDAPSGRDDLRPPRTRTRTSCAWSAARTSRAARTVAASATIRARNAAVIGTVAALLRRGEEEGVVPPRRGPARPPPPDQRLLLLPRVEPPHPRRHLRPGPDGAGPRGRRTGA